MKLTLSIVAATLLATAGFAILPSAEAVGSCTYFTSPCPALVCLGYNSQTGWQKCYVPIHDADAPVLP